MGYSPYSYQNQSAPSPLLEDLALLGQAFGSAFRTLARIRSEAPWTDYRGRPL